MQGLGRVVQSWREKIRAVDDIQRQLAAVAWLLAHVEVRQAIRELLALPCSRWRLHSETKVKGLVLVVGILLSHLADVSAVQVDQGNDNDHNRNTRSRLAVNLLTGNIVNSRHTDNDGNSRR